MTRISKRRTMIAVALAAVIAGGVIAAVTSARSIGHPGHPRTVLGLAAGYLDVSQGQLRKDLARGQSLAQVAAGTPGRSAGGLVGVLLKSRRARLAAEEARLTARVRATIERPGGPLRAGRRPVLGAILSYLGLTPRELRADRRAGLSLGEIANRTAGRSEAGLIATIISLRSARIYERESSGKAKGARLAQIEERVKALVDRTPAKGKKGARR